MSWFKRKGEPQITRQLGHEDVVRAYGAVLSQSSRGFGGSIPERSLPCDKSIIKASLIEAASKPGVSKEYLASLEVAFCSLADFQPDGGGESVFADPRMRGGQLSEDEITALAQKIAAGGDAELSMTNRIQSEFGKLMAEWHETLARKRVLQ